MHSLGLDRVSVGYDGQAVVRDLSVYVDSGKMVALIGPNGAGKSTVLKTTAGIIPPISGRVMIEEKDISSLSRAKVASAMSVMLTERRGASYMSVFDVVRIGRYRHTGVLGIPRAADIEAINEAMERVGVRDIADREFLKLSDGQKQRVLLARAIVSEPKILILDEPTSFLDIGYKISFFETLKRLAADDGIAILISLHEIEFIRSVADTVVCITANGNIDRVGKTNDIITTDYIEELFSVEKGKYGEYYGRRS